MRIVTLVTLFHNHEIKRPKRKIYYVWRHFCSLQFKFVILNLENEYHRLSIPKSRKVGAIYLLIPVLWQRSKLLLNKFIN